MSKIPADAGNCWCPVAKCGLQLREHRGESEARVFSAVPLTDAEKEALRQKLEKRFHRRMILDCQVPFSISI